MVWLCEKIPVIVCIILVTICLILPAGAADGPGPGLSLVDPAVEPPSPAAAAAPGDVQVRLSSLPLSFIPNQGQYDPAVKYVVTGPKSTLFFTSDEIVIATVEGAGNEPVSPIIRQTFPGASADPMITGTDQLTGTANFFMGNDPSHWQTGVPTFSAVEYHDLYPGIDLRYKGTEGTLKREFIVAPGADPAMIRLRYEGIDAITVDESGALVLTAGTSTLKESPLVCYQEIRGAVVPVKAVYRVPGDHEAAFTLGQYDPAFPLVIDPRLVYSTFLGGTGDDSGNSIAVDSSGNTYVTGFTVSTDFPTTAGAFDPTYGGGGNQDAFIAKLNAAGSYLVYSTYLGGTGADSGNGIAVDSSGNAYIIGATYSSDFPITAGAYNNTYGGNQNAFVTKLNATGSVLVYSTFLGGKGYDSGNGIAVDSSGNAYVTGDTFSTDFQTTEGAYNRTYGGNRDAFVTKLNAAGSDLVYSTYLGATMDDYSKGIAVDSSGNAYVAGDTYSTDFPTTAGAYNRTHGGNLDAFATKLNAAGSVLVYSTFLGGTGYDYGNSIAVDSSGSAYVTGTSYSSNFPTTGGAFDPTYDGGGYDDAFIAKLNAVGSDLVYSTFLGGTTSDYGLGIAVDSSGNAYVTGKTISPDFPTTAGANNRTWGGSYDAFITKLNAAGSGLVYSTYLGGTIYDNGNGIAVDSSGNAYLTGNTQSSDFPTTAGAYDLTKGGFQDVFIAKFSFAGSGIGVFRSGQWILDYGIDGTINRRFQFGLATDKPLVGDFNNDGTPDIGVFRSGQWILDYGIDGTINRRFPYGLSSDKPLVGDFNNDGTTDIGVFRSGQWILDYGIDGTVNRRFSYGLATDTPLAGDFNNDGTPDIGVFRSGQWILDYGIDGTINRRFSYGLATDKPLVGDFDNDRTTDIGVFRSGQWILDYRIDGTVNRRFSYGLATDIPIVGNWN